MELIIQQKKLISSRTIKKENLILFLVISIFLYFIFLFFDFQRGIFSYANVLQTKMSSIEFITSSNPQSVLVPWLVISSIIFICMIPFGLLTNVQPKPLSEIITSSTLKISHQTSLDHGEYVIIDLGVGKVTLTWKNKAGPTQNWKILVTLHNFDSTGSLQYLAKLLFMEKDLSEDNRFNKVIFIKDWPKQEYLLKYWLKSLY